jgi:PKD repeat protein
LAPLFFRKIVIQNPNLRKVLRISLFLVLCFSFFTGVAQECGIIYVTPNGASSGAAGTRDNPASLAHAFTLVDAANNHLRLSHGLYPLGQTLDIPSDITIEGGFIASTWFKSNSDSTIFERDAANYDLVNKALIGLRIVGQTDFRLQDVVVKVADAPSTGISVYGIYVSGCSDYVISRCIVFTGDGSDGIDGAPGAQGQGGAAGQNGETGIDEGNCCRAGGAGASGSFAGSNGGGQGGDGGEWGGFEVQEVCDPIFNFCQWIITPGSEFTNPGANGLPGSGSGGGPGGQRGVGVCEITYAVQSCPALPINYGKPGNNGYEGIDGGPGLQGFGSIIGGFYIPGIGQTGDPGQTNGSGGGGGGGGGGKGCEPAALDPYFPTSGSAPYDADTAYNTAGSGGGGGGGGEGGQFGLGGLGGLGGGGSFCIFVNGNGQNGVVQDCRYFPGQGGQGGQGGDGGPGGPGGAGGLGGFLGDSGPVNSCNVGKGGDGGAGGPGGAGGRGGKGSDGFSRGLYQVQGDPVLDPNIYNPWEPEISVEYFGCTNSDVSVTTNATGNITWIFGFGASPQNSTSSNDTVQYSGLLGSRNLTLIVDGVPYFYANYILVEEPFDPPIIDASRNTICAGESTVLSTTFDGLSYDWTIPGGSITASSDQNPGEVTFAQPGDYILELIVTSCCGISKTTDTIHVLEQVEVDLGEDLRACFLSDLPVLDGGGNDGATYAWTLNGSPLGGNTRLQNTIMTATYGVTVSYGASCSGSDDVYVEIYTITPVELGPDQAICPGSPLPVLNASVEQASYAWTVNGNPIGTNSIELEVNLPGIYEVNVTEESGCAGSDDVEVLVSQPTVFLGADINVCANAAFPTLDANNQGATFEWFLDGVLIPGATAQTFQPSGGGVYDVIITNIYGCEATDQLEVFTFPTLNAGFNAPLNAELGQPVQFVDATTPNPTAWTWNFGDGSAIVSQQNPTHSFQQVGERPVFLIASNSICSDTAYAVVDVLYNCDALGLTAGFSTAPDIIVLSGAGTVITTNTSSNATQYSWDFGDGSDANPNVSPIHAYTAVGSYDITLTAINYNCTTTVSQSVTVEEFGVGIGEELTTGALQVYPNPNTGQFAVVLELDRASAMRIELNNAMGQRVYMEHLPEQHYWRKDFDLSSFVKGIYLLRVSTDEGQLERRIVVQ